MSNDTDTTEAAPPAEEKSKFSLPSAYTILFALIVIMAAATWIIPAGQYALDADGSPIPGTYQEVDSNPQRILVDSLDAPINGLYGIEDEATGNIDVFNSGHLFGAIDVALFILVIGGFIGITMKTGAIQAGIALLDETPPRQGALDDPDPDDGVRHRRQHVRHGRGKSRLLRADHHRHDRRRLRRDGRRRRDPARRRHRCAGFDGQPVRHRHRVRIRRRADQRRHRRATRHPGRRPRHGHLVRLPLRGAGAAGRIQVAGVRHEGRQRRATSPRRPTATATS